MIIEELNKSLIRLLIENYKENETYSDCVKRIIREYRKSLEYFNFGLYDINEPSFLLSEIDEISQAVLSCIEQYNRAKIAEAIIMMTGIVKKYTKKLRSLIIDNNNEYQNWYKIRPQEDLVRLYKAKEMFHIPFEKRYRVKNQRFSISGYPCLYLGRSVWGCWEEMHEMDFRIACVSRFEVQKKLQLLNLSLPKTNDNYIEIQEVDNLLRTWPLIIACSIKVLKPQEPFKAEYIVPQLLMLAITNHEDFEGCAYTSTQRNEYFAWNIDLLCNIAIPVKKVLPKGLCPELCAIFKVTNSVKEEYLRLKGDANKYYNPPSYIDKHTLVFPPSKEGYAASTFCLVEEILKTEDAIQINE